MNEPFNQTNLAKFTCITCLMVCLCVSLPSQATTDLKVIYDAGNTRPTGIHLNESRIQLSDVPPPEIDEVSFTQYPVSATKLSVGPVEPQAVQLPPTFQPVFIVGSDEISQQWLQLNQDRLFALRAVGILTQAESESDLKALKQQFPKLVFMPMSTDAIAQYLPTKHYPVLITRDRIEQ